MIDLSKNATTNAYRSLVKVHQLMGLNMSPFSTTVEYPSINSVPCKPEQDESNDCIKAPIVSNVFCPSSIQATYYTCNSPEQLVPNPVIDSATFSCGFDSDLNSVLINEGKYNCSKPNLASVLIDLAKFTYIGPPPEPEPEPEPNPPLTLPKTWSVATPAMTGYTTPSGEVEVSSEEAPVGGTNFYGWQAFDGNIVTYWASAKFDTTSRDVKYNFGTPVVIQSCRVISSSYDNAPSDSIRDYIIQGRHAGQAPVEIVSGTKLFSDWGNGATVAQFLDFYNDVAYSEYILKIQNNQGGDYISISAVEWLTNVTRY